MNKIFPDSLSNNSRVLILSTAYLILGIIILVIYFNTSPESQVGRKILDIFALIFILNGAGVLLNEAHNTWIFKDINVSNEITSVIATTPYGVPTSGH